MRRIWLGERWIQVGGFERNWSDPKSNSISFWIWSYCSTDGSEVGIGRMLSEAIDHLESRCERMSLFSKTVLSCFALKAVGSAGSKGCVWKFHSCDNQRRALAIDTVVIFLSLSGRGNHPILTLLYNEVKQVERNEMNDSGERGWSCRSGTVHYTCSYRAFKTRLHRKFPPCFPYWSEHPIHAICVHTHISMLTLREIEYRNAPFPGTPFLWRSHQWYRTTGRLSYYKPQHRYIGSV